MPFFAIKEFFTLRKAQAESAEKGLRPVCFAY
jgi:hypothetical protein